MVVTFEDTAGPTILPLVRCSQDEVICDWDVHPSRPSEHALTIVIYDHEHLWSYVLKGPGQSSLDFSQACTEMKPSPHAGVNCMRPCQGFHTTPVPGKQNPQPSLSLVSPSFTVKKRHAYYCSQQPQENELQMMFFVFPTQKVKSVESFH